MARLNNEGSVYYNKQRKKWNAQYMEYDPLTDTNKRKTKTFKSEADAEKFLATLMYQKENPIFIEHNGIPLNELMRAQLKLKYDTNQITATQLARVTRTIESIEKNKFAYKKIDEIKPEELQAYMNTLKHLSNSSISKYYQVINQAFKVAINKGYIMRNPMASVIKIRSDKKSKEVRALTVEEQQNFTNWLLEKEVKDCKYKNVFLIQMYMGLRVGEALALTMHDVDLKNKRIRVHRTLTTDEYNAVIMGDSTKTYAGNRVVPIPDYLYAHIVEQMKIADKQENNPEKLLFKSYNAKYARRTDVISELHRRLEKNFGIKDISTHSLRHSYGTRCIESGMAPVVVQRLMGHTDIGITLNTYTSVFDKFKEEELDKVNKYYMKENMLEKGDDNEK